MSAVAPSRDCSVLKPVQDNVDLSSSSSAVTTKRLTMVERARLEALAAFGNEGLDSLSVKKTDLSKKLKSVTPAGVGSKTIRPLTRMEKAKIEAATSFKNVKLGEMIKIPRKRKIQDTDEHNTSKKQNQITLTRIQKAKQEAEKAFENVSLDKIPPKRSRLEKEKMEKKLLEGKMECKPSDVKKTGRSKSPLSEIKPVSKSSKAPDKGFIVPEIRSTGVNNPKRLTRFQSAKIVALKCANSKGIEDPGGDALCKENVERVSKNCEEKSMESDRVAMETTHDDVSSIAPQSYQDNSINNGPGKKNGQKRLTRIERAKLEALKSFKGQEFGAICKHSTRIVAKHLKLKKDQSCNTENEELWNTPKHIPGQNDQDELKHKESFQLKCALLIGNEIPNTTTPLHQQLKQKRPKDVYSSIIEENFKDQSSLLETSRRVVKTAIELETPEGSPM